MRACARVALGQMSLDRQYGHVIMCCDSCGETLEGDHGEFDALIERASSRLTPACCFPTILMPKMGVSGS
jgi:hypothetical protein